MSEYIPTELLDQILLRLAIGSLVRFTSVCKSWYSLIASPSFIAEHTKRNSTKKLLLRIYNSDEMEESYLLCRADEKFGNELDQLDSPSSISLRYKRLVGSCNGLVCMVDLDTLPRCIVLWNPLIRKSVTLPLPPTLPETFNPPLIVFGFGAHPTTHQYMLVFIAFYQRKFRSKVELYTQGTGSWRSIASVGLPKRKMVSFSLQAFVNGAIHWIATERKGNWLGSFIMLFDMGSQVFSEIMMPANHNTLDLSIMSYRESLAVTCREQVHCISMWVMKEYGVVASWARLYTITLTGELSSSLHLIRFRENGEVLLQMYGSQLVNYDCEAKTFANIGYIGTTCTFVADNLKESLVLVNHGH